ncbi:unnamed protein product [Lactuca saligna]|uniref:Uncharacterized protein n=1 Tax=Lactuca saligna TaxID=75948 RepID=A0AA35ZXE6_LACSI|nr:unnamed protein product [Lactuca saligna]
MDYDDIFQSDHGDDNNNQHQNLLDHNLDDELEHNDWQSNRQERARQRRPFWISRFDDDVEDEMVSFVKDDSDSGGGKRKKFSSGGGSSSKKKENKLSASKFSDRGGRLNEKGGSKFKNDKEGPRMLDDDNFIDECGDNRDKAFSMLVGLNYN